MFTISSSSASIAPFWAPSHSRISPSPVFTIFSLSFARDLFRKPVPTFRDHARLSFLWIKCVTQPVTEQIERQHGEENRKPGPDRHSGRVREEALRRVEHRAPRG